MSPAIGQMIRFAGATPLVLLASVVLPVVLHRGFGLDPRIAVAIGLAAAFVLSFLLLRLVVFRSAGPIRRQVVLFLALSLVWRVTEYAAFRALFGAGVAFEAGLILVLAVSAVFKFLICRYVIFVPGSDGSG